MLADPAQIAGVKIHKLICLPILGKASTTPEQVILRAMGVAKNQLTEYLTWRWYMLCWYILIHADTCSDSECK